MSKNYVLYHASCLDGSGAAYAAWRHLGDTRTEYIPVQYGQDIPEIDSGANVYILDFSYSRDVLEALRQRSKGLVVLDHHKTAKEALEGFPGATFDMNKSGAVLAWEYFHPGEQTPTLLKYIEDRDLWKWKYAELTKAVTAALPLYKDFRDWCFFTPNDESLSCLLTAGQTKLEFDAMEIEAAKKKTIIVNYPLDEGKGFARCGFLNATGLVSEIGNAIYEELPVDFSLSYFIHSSGDVVFSFRSDKSFDVSELAKALGGGGHFSAAGARVPSEQGFKLLQQLYANRVVVVE